MQYPMNSTSIILMPFTVSLSTILSTCFILTSPNFSKFIPHVHQVYARASAQYEWIQSNVCSFSKYPPDWFNCEDAAPASLPSDSPSFQPTNNDPTTLIPSGSGAFSPCSFCDGKTILDDVTIPDSHGLTCEFTAFSAKTIDASSDECTSLSFSEWVCCPDDVDPILIGVIEPPPRFVFLVVLTRNGLQYSYQLPITFHCSLFAVLHHHLSAIPLQGIWFALFLSSHVTSVQ